MRTVLKVTEKNAVLVNRKCFMYYLKMVEWNLWGDLNEHKQCCTGFIDTDRVLDIYVIVLKCGSNLQSINFDHFIVRLLVCNSFSSMYMQTYNLEGWLNQSHESYHKYQSI